MIEGLRPYPAYRDSGLAWLGQMPAHWEIRRLKFLLHEVDQRSTSGKEQLLRVSQYTGVTQRLSAEGSDAPNTRAASLVGYKKVNINDLVVNIMLAWNGSLGVSRHEGIASPAYCVYRFNRMVLPWYCHELLRLPAYKGRIKLASTGVVESRLRLYSDDLKCIEALLPPVQEQAAIVHYLDHATRQLDKAIRAKRKTIALLNEQKQAIIQRAVTRGLKPNEVLKDSNILWLDEIPAHWDVVALKTLAEIQSGITLGKVYASEQLTEYPYLRVANVQAGRLALGTVKKLLLPKAEANRSMLRTGDVLMTEGGDPDKLGRGCVWGGEIDNCIHQNHVFAVRPSSARLRSSFLSAPLESHYAKRYFLQTAKQTTNLASTNKTTIGRFRVPLPNLDEQDAIIRGIENESKPIAQTAERIEREMVLLREYRTRLIADIVTGKLDVREAAARLPMQDPAATEPASAPDDSDFDEPPEDLAEDLAETEAGA